MSTVLLLVAGVIGGVIGTAGGITSLVAYPALLVVGLGPVQANVANTVALISGAVASSVAGRRELRVHCRRLPRWAAVAASGGTAGAVLLLVTPADVFAWVVPVLVAFAAVLVLVRPSTGAPQDDRPAGDAEHVNAERVNAEHVDTERVDAERVDAEHVNAEHVNAEHVDAEHVDAERVHGGQVDGRQWTATVAFLGVSVYSGYFGAGSGILTLAVVLLLIDRDVVRANAVKNALTACADILPAVMFALVADVAWWAVMPLAVGAGIGGAVGPAVTRRLDPRVLRAGAALMGFALAGWLTLQAAGG